jgi:DNA segregation ATPase FtsK/SpoIIIE, S-DNA-T family
MPGKTSATPRAGSRSGTPRPAAASGRASTRGAGSGTARTAGSRSTASKKPAARAGSTKAAGSRATSRTPGQPPHEPSPIVTAIKGIGRGLKRLWLVGARWLGSAVRAIGRGAAATRDIDPVHRRDGIAFGLIALAVVCAIGSWLQAAGPVGAVADDAVRVWIGALAIVFPIALVVVAIILMRTEPDPEQRPRRIAGGVAVILSITGIL